MFSRRKINYYIYEGIYICSLQGKTNMRAISIYGWMQSCLIGITTEWILQAYFRVNINSLAIANYETEHIFTYACFVIVIVLWFPLLLINKYLFPLLYLASHHWQRQEGEEHRRRRGGASSAESGLEKLHHRPMGLLRPGKGLSK